LRVFQNFRFIFSRIFLVHFFWFFPFEVSECPQNSFILDIIITVLSFFPRNLFSSSIFQVQWMTFCLAKRVQK